MAAHEWQPRGTIMNGNQAWDIVSPKEISEIRISKKTYTLWYLRPQDHGPFPRSSPQDYQMPSQPFNLAVCRCSRRENQGPSTSTSSTRYRRCPCAMVQACCWISRQNSPADSGSKPGLGACSTSWVFFEPPAFICRNWSKFTQMLVVSVIDLYGDILWARL